MTEQEYLQAIKSEEDGAQPSYLHANVRYSNEITDFEKILFSEITLLTHSLGTCFVSSNYFTKAFNKSKDTISKAINNLTKAGFIETETLYNNSNEIVWRVKRTLKEEAIQ